MAFLSFVVQCLKMLIFHMNFKDTLYNHVESPWKKYITLRNSLIFVYIVPLPYLHGVILKQMFLHILKFMYSLKKNTCIGVA